MTTIRVEHASFSYGERKVLNGITVAFDRSEFTCLLGANGSGKTTLFRLLAHELRPDSGTAPVGTSVTYLPQRLPVPEYLSVQELVSMSRYGSSNAWGWRLSGEDRVAVGNAMERCGVRQMADRQFVRLSGGEAQRVWLAFCLAQRRDFVLLDEPMRALDFRSEREFFSLLSVIPHESGTGVVISTHNLSLANEFADRIVVLRDGRTVWDGPPGAEDPGAFL